MRSPRTLGLNSFTSLGDLHRLFGVAEKEETRFRRSAVRPFLKTLKNTYFFAIQQLAISGDPDYLLCVRGKFVAMELKRSGEEPRPLQKYKLDEIERTGGLSLVATPDNWDQIKLFLTELDGEPKDDHY